MKNEIMARALTQIEDALLEDAQKKTPKRGQNFLRGLYAAAACLAVLFCSVLFLRLTAVPGITVNGTELGTEPIPVAASAEPYVVRFFDGSERVTLQISVRRETEIRVSSGTFDVFCGTERIGSGTSFTGQGELSVRWVIPDADSRQCYEMTVGSTTLLLTYDSSLNGWIICKK